MKMRAIMVNRRKTLLAMFTAAGAVLCNAAFGRLAASDQTKSEAASDASSIPSGGSANDAAEVRLRQDLDRLGERAYSDEGIPVFLACEDLAGAKAGMPGAPITDFSATLASDVRRDAQAWQRIFPDAPDTDVSKLIEVLADRDFNHSNDRR